MKLIESLEEHDDVQSVAANLEIPDDYDASEWAPLLELIQGSQTPAMG